MATNDKQSTASESSSKENSESQPPQKRAGLWFVGGTLWALLFVVILFSFWNRKQPDSSASSSANNETGDLISAKKDALKTETVTVPEFEFLSQEGKKITRKELLGKPWVVNFIFTKCMMTCPALTTSMDKLNRNVKGVDVRLVSITVDPDRDTPEQLKTYSEVYGAKPERWLFLTGKKAQLYDLIQNTFSATVIEESSPRLGYEFAHSNRVIHIDKNGLVVGTYNGMDEEDMAILAQVLKGRRKTPENKKFLRVVPSQTKKELKAASPYSDRKKE